LKARRDTAIGVATYQQRLAKRILDGGADASRATMELLEYSDVETLDEAVALVAAHGVVSTESFDCLADAWETYRHFRDLSWD
jgi:hypothetical protein